MPTDQPTGQTLADALHNIVSRLLEVARLHRGRYVVVGDVETNALYLGLLRLAEDLTVLGVPDDLAEQVEPMRTALADLRALLPNMIEHPETDWDDIDPVARALQARMSEMLIDAQVSEMMVTDRVSSGLPEEALLVLLTGFDRGIEQLRIKRREADKAFEAMAARAAASSPRDDHARPVTASGDDRPDTSNRAGSFSDPVHLSADEKEEFQRQGFKSRLELNVTGERRKTRNVIVVGDVEVLLSNAEFKAFLLLAFAVGLRRDGWVRRESLRSGAGLELEGEYFPSGVDQALTRLRNSFALALGELRGTDFLETSGDGRFRLSTHRRYVIWNRDALMQYPQREIRAIAEQLPDA